MFGANRFRVLLPVLILVVIAVCLDAVYLPKPLAMFQPYRAMLATICYGLLSVFLVVYVVSVSAIRWPVVPIGAGLGYLAGILGQYATLLLFEPERWIYPIYHRGLDGVAQSLMSSLIVSLVLGIWLSGAVAGGLVHFLDRCIGHKDGAAE